jgi:hypothetical protein
MPSSRFEILRRRPFSVTKTGWFSASFSTLEKFLAPRGRPRGLPDWPFLKRVQLVDKFAMAEMQATKMLLGLMLERERLMAAAPPAERPSLGTADEKVDRQSVETAARRGMTAPSSKRENEPGALPRPACGER